jgi:hypothetical protein
MMIEDEVSALIQEYFKSKGLGILGKFDAFDHNDDKRERSLVIDLAIGPRGTKGLRTEHQKLADQNLFQKHASTIDSAIEELREISIFPKDQKRIKSWSWEPNPNPLVGIAIEIENNLSKYFLGSLLAAAITGRWGIVVIQDIKGEDRWVNTIQRMMHKGSSSPIPSNIIILSWTSLCQKITESQEGEEVTE